MFVLCSFACLLTHSVIYICIYVDVWPHVAPVCFWVYQKKILKKSWGPMSMPRIVCGRGKSICHCISATKPVHAPFRRAMSL